jgi:histidinol-phosphate phosphatase family protein
MNCVFLDRDGTLIRHIPYLCDLRQVQLLPTVVSGLGELLKADCRLFLHTNQSGIGRGYFSLREALACNSEMIRQIGLGPDLFAGVCLCPEAPGQPIEYRKPSPKYAREVMITYATDVRRLCYIGDNITDLMTAREVGCASTSIPATSRPPGCSTRRGRRWLPPSCADRGRRRNVPARYDSSVTAAIPAARIAVGLACERQRRTVQSGRDSSDGRRRPSG